MIRRRTQLAWFAAAIVVVAGYFAVRDSDAPPVDDPEPVADTEVHDVSATAAPDAGPAFLWRARGNRNTVYVLGSVHMLRKSDYPLPAPILAAYDDAERLVMEIDLDDLDPVHAQTLMVELGRIAGSDTLETLLGPERWQSAVERAEAIDIDLSMLARVEPWVAAMTVLNLELSKLGYSPDDGVEMFFSRKAVEDEKPVTGLETIDYQLGLFDSLPIGLQAEFLLLSLADAGSLDDKADDLMRAWRSADLDAMEKQMLDGFRDMPRLYDVLVRQRNEAWVDALMPLFDETDDYLVIVGAMHLVGKDSLIGLLERRGVAFRQP